MCRKWFRFKSRSAPWLLLVVGVLFVAAIGNLLYSLMDLSYLTPFVTTHCFLKSSRRLSLDGRVVTALEMVVQNTTLLLRRTSLYSNLTGQSFTCCYTPPLVTGEARQTNFGDCRALETSSSKTITWIVAGSSVLAFIALVCFPLFRCVDSFLLRLEETLDHRHQHKLLLKNLALQRENFHTKVHLWLFLNEHLGDAALVVYKYLKYSNSYWCFCTPSGVPQTMINFSIPTALGSKGPLKEDIVKIEGDWYTRQRIKDGFEMAHGGTSCFIRGGLPIEGHWVTLIEFLQLFQQFGPLELRISGVKLVGYCVDDSRILKLIKESLQQESKPPRIEIL